jgi:hypothetical protein
MTRPRRAGAIASLVALSWALTAPAARADAGSGALLSFTAAVQAPLMQITYDNPTAPFHPLGDGELTYALSTLDATRGHALSSVAWPGSAGGNAGSLLGVLGAPTVAALNDPIKADVSSGAGPDQQTMTAPSGTLMSASVHPAGPGQETVLAETKTASTPLGPSGSIGTSSASSSISLIQSTGSITAKAVTTAVDISLGGVVSIGSVASTATTTSAGGSAPKASSSTVFQDFKIAGQQVYVDASGAHVGALGKPANPAAIAVVDKALAGSGLQIFFTAPYQFAIGGLTYNYAASVLLYWAPPEANKDVFSLSFGGAAVSMEVTPGFGGADQNALPPAVQSGSGSEAAALPIPTSPQAPSLSLPTPATAAAPGPSSQSRPASAPPVVQLAAPVNATSRGVGAQWFVLLAALAILGAALLPRVPALLRASAGCTRERPYRPRPYERES